MLDIFLLSTDQNTGGLSIIHQSAPEDNVVLELLMITIKNLIKRTHKNSVIDMKKCQPELRATLDLSLWVTPEMT